MGMGQKRVNRRGWGRGGLIEGAMGSEGQTE